MSGSETLEVALGLVFIVFVFSSICSAANEAIRRLLDARGKALFDAINALIGDVDLAKSFWRYSLITGLMGARSSTIDKQAVIALGTTLSNRVGPGSKLTLKATRKLRSYIAPSIFAAVGLDVRATPG